MMNVTYMGLHKLIALLIKERVEGISDYDAGTLASDILAVLG